MSARRPISSIDEAIEAMDARIDRCLDTGDRGGLFAVVYRAVTARVRDDIREGLFDDCERLERFDVLFARRYLDAVRAWDEDAPVPHSWALAFETDTRADRIALQHVLLGINAHINLDLGIAAVDATAAGEVDELRADFELINDVLADLIDQMQHAIATVSPWSALVDRVGLRLDEALASFVLRQARAEAWDLAVSLSRLPPEARESAIERRDRAVMDFGRRIAQPSGPLRWAVSLALRRERDDLAAVAAALTPA